MLHELINLASNATNRTESIPWADIMPPIVQVPTVILSVFYIAIGIMIIIQIGMNLYHRCVHYWVETFQKKTLHPF